MTHTVELFVSEHCPACPKARLVARALADVRPDVDLVERDVAHTHEQAGRYHLFATPAWVIDGRHVMYGAPTVAALVACIERGWSGTRPS